MRTDIPNLSKSIMPIDPTRPASDYTTYVRERADIVRKGEFDFSSSLFKSAVFASAYAPREPPVSNGDYGILTGFGYDAGKYLLYRDLNPGTSNFTVECFFKANYVANLQYIWAFDKTDQRIGLRFAGGILGLRGNVSGGLGSIEPNTWYFAAITRSGNSWYGTLNNTTVLLTNKSFDLSDLDLSIGGDYYDEALYVPFSGSISNFRYVKRALYSPEATTIPDRPLQDIDDTELLLIATQNAKFADTSGNNRVAEGYLPVWSLGPSESYGILGFGHPYLLYRDLNPGTSNFTVECFFKANDVANLQYIWAFDKTNPWIGLGVQDSILGLRGNVSGGLGSIEPNTWYFAAITRSGNSWYGTLNNTTVLLTNKSFDLSDLDLSIGGDYYDEALYSPFSGSISNFRVSNYARYTTNFTVPTPPLSSQGARLLLLAKENAPFADSSGNNLVAEGTYDWLPGPIDYP